MSIWAITSTILLAGALLAAGIVYLQPVARPDQIRFDVATPQMPDPRYITISPDGTAECKSQFDTTLVGSATLA